MACIRYFYQLLPTTKWTVSISLISKHEARVYLPELLDLPARIKIRQTTPKPRRLCAFNFGTKTESNCTDGFCAHAALYSDFVFVMKYPLQSLRVSKKRYSLSEMSVSKPSERGSWHLFTAKHTN